MANNKIIDTVELAAQRNVSGDAETASLINQLLLAELQDKAKTKLDAANQKEAQKITVRAQVEHESREMRANQEACCHYHTTTGQARLNGQYDHQNNVHLVCSGCGKSFNKTNLPPNLLNRIKWENIGGPGVRGTASING